MIVMTNNDPQGTEALYSTFSSMYPAHAKGCKELERFLQRKANEGRVTFKKGLWDVPR
jgi:hypothetical protein